jgi:glycosyltransferase involved in cell wall biosynthesis
MKVLCIVDSYEWALNNRAQALKKYNQKHYFDIKYFNDLNNISFENYDVVYSLNWPIHGYIYKKIKPNRRYRLVTTISSHIGQPKDSEFLKILNSYDAVSVSNKILYNDFKSKFKKLKVFYTPFGVDTDLFYKKTEPELYNNVFGWVGNSSRSVKRYNNISNIFKSLGAEYEFLTVDHNSKFDKSKMNDFYNKIGTLVCFSISEGTPNPILEAAACGRNIISTPVGNVPDLIRKNKSIQVVSSIDDLKRAIIFTFKNSNKVKDNGSFLNKEIYNNWTWEKRVNSFNIFLGLK